MDTSFDIYWKHKRRINHVLLAYISAGQCSLLFLISGIEKWVDNGHFYVIIQNEPLLKEFADFFTLFIPTLELVIAVLIIIPSTRFLGLTLFYLLMMLFTIYTLYLMLAMNRLPCGCNFMIRHVGAMGHMVINGLFILIAVYAYSILIQKKWDEEDKRARRSKVDEFKFNH
ncbi:Methylamine utilisation protein MauE [bacterium A37T11]|nr:Methylamine utilisation protein MauE [bacterium A37T11]